MNLKETEKRFKPEALLKTPESDTSFRGCGEVSFVDWNPFRPFLSDLSKGLKHLKAGGACSSSW